MWYTFSARQRRYLNIKINATEKNYTRQFKFILEKELNLRSEIAKTRRNRNSRQRFKYRQSRAQEAALDQLADILIVQ